MTMKNKYKYMKFRLLLDKVLAYFLVILMAVLVINVLWQVASRYVFSNPSSFTDELAGFLLIWVSLFGAAYATGQKSHLAIELFPQKLPPEKRKKLDVVINIIIAAFAFFVFVIGGARLVYITLLLEQISSALKIPVGYVYTVLPISGLVIMYYAISEIFTGIPSEEERETIK